MVTRNTKYIPAATVLTGVWSLLPAIEIRLEKNVYDHGWDVTVVEITADDQDEVDAYEFDSKREAIEQARALKTELWHQGYKRISLVK